MIVSLYCRKNLLKKQNFIFSIVTILFSSYLNSLDLSSSIEKLKFFTFPDHMMSLTFLCLTSAYLEVSFFVPRIHSTILDSSLTESFHLNNILIFIWIKFFWLSNAWKCLIIPCVDYSLIRNIFSIEHV